MVTNTFKEKIMIKYPKEVLEERFNLYRDIVANKIIELTSDGTDLDKVLHSRTINVYAGHMLKYARQLEELNNKKGDE
jgi:hypothetical protein